MEYRNIFLEEARPCGYLYVDGFLKQLCAIFGRKIPVNLVIDFLILAHRIEKDGLIAACEKNEVVGFALMTRNPSRFFVRIVISGFFPVIAKFFKGRYRGISLSRSIQSILEFILFFRTSAGTAKNIKTGQVITMVVARNMRGKGIGANLLVKGLEYLKKYVCAVKLEVREENLPAIGLYKKYGFVEIGRVRSRVGTSKIMVKYFKN